jgi:outer membrane protein assembly factor BamB
MYAFGIVGSITVLLAAGTASAQNWPTFRGPDASGVAATAKPPVQWDLATSKNVAWKTVVPGLAHSSPIVWGNRIYVTTAVPSSGTPTVITCDSSKSGISSAADMVACTDNGILSAYNPKTGERIYQERVSSKAAGISASPVAADGRIYLASEDGDVFVVRAGREFELLATNPMGEILMATPAISGNLLIVRTGTQIVAVRG